MELLNLFGSVNYLAVAVCMVASIIVGSTWYSPGVFFTTWWKGIGKGDAKPGSSNMVLVFGLTFVASYVKLLGVALVLSLAFHYLGGPSVVTGLLVAFALWLFTVAPTYLTNHLFAGWGPKIYFIEVLNHLIDFLVAAVILSLWR